jgi:hypothetical protein
MGAGLGLIGLLQNVLGLPEEQVNQVREILHGHASDVKHGHPMQAGAGVFGGSTKGSGLEHHTSVAHQHVIDALNSMSEGLQIYAENLQDFANDLNERDFQAAADLTPSRKRELLDAGDDLNSPDLHNGGGEN